MPDTFPLACERQGIYYTLLAPLCPDFTRLEFSGVFQNQAVVWDTSLKTLERYHADQSVITSPLWRSAFLEIGDQTGRTRQLDVVLDISHIDEPVLLRTVIMVRNYKRLRPGRHSFGERREFMPPESTPR